MAITLQQTINWAQTFVEYTPLTAGLGQEPAVSIATMIRNSLLNAGVGPWYWNRNSASFALIKGEQDYSVSLSDFGYLEKASVTDAQGNIFEIKDVYNIKPLSQSQPQQRPNAISVEATGGLSSAGGTLDTSATSGSASAVAVTANSATPNFSNEVAFVFSTTTELSTLGSPSGSWTLLDINTNFYSQLITGTNTVNIAQSISPSSEYSSVMGLFSLAVPGQAPTLIQTHGLVSGFITEGTPNTGSFVKGTTQGSGILVVVQLISVVVNALASVTVEDTNDNEYTLVGLINPGGAGGSSATACAVYWSPDVVPGTEELTVTLVGASGSGAILIYEVAGIASSGTNITFRFLGVPDQAYTANIIYQKKSGLFGPFFINEVGASDGVYNGVFDPYSFPVGSTANITGFTNSANNGSFEVTACTTTTLTVDNASSVSQTGASAYATNFDWAPIPDQYSDIYNNLFLAEILAMADDARSEVYRRRGVAAFMSKATGLSDTQRNVFVEQWQARTDASASSALRTQQGSQARTI